MSRTRIKGVLLDIDGVLWIGGALQPGAEALMTAMRAARMPFRLLTNDVTAAARDRYSTLVGAGCPLSPFELITIPQIALHWFASSGIRTIMYLGASALRSEFEAGVTVLAAPPVDAVVVGDLFDWYERRELETAVKTVVGGARLVALHRNAWWFDGVERHMDNGFWVAGFEYVARRTATVVGKPSPIAYRFASSRLRVRDRRTVAFVSDDVEVDLFGAHHFGLTTIFYGPRRSLPRWVDGRATNMRELRELVLGGNNG